MMKILLLLCSAVTVQAASVTLVWNPSPGTNIAGYKVYYGVASRTYTNAVDVGNVTNTTIGGLFNGATYYFAVTAYTATGLESDYSNEASFSFPTIGTNFTLNLSPPSLRTVILPYSVLQVQVSDDLRSWATLTNVQTVDGIVAISDPATRPKRFYRARIL